MQLDYQVSSFVKSKEPEIILKTTFKSWILIYSAPEKFLTENRGEFANSKLQIWQNP